MRNLRILPAVLAVAVCCSAQAQPQSQPAIKHLSGEFSLILGLDLSHDGILPFSAQLRTRTGDTCHLTGSLRVYETSPRRVETVPGATFIHCPGSAPALVVGNFAPSDWTPPQSRRCRTYSHGKYGSSCLGYSVTAPVGAAGMWITWHSITSEQVAQKKGLLHD
jgi:hypothetical protein